MAVIAFAPILGIAAQVPDTPSLQEARAAIWSDIQLNATIGNYNELVSWDWYYGTDKKHPPTLTIQGLECRRGTSYRCEFDLARQSNEAASPADRAQPSHLRCTASFRWAADDRRWTVIHFPPPKGGGHTYTSMRCERGQS